MSAAVDGAAAAVDLPESEAYALRQYEIIIRFGDNILAGKHATVKPPLLDDIASVPSQNTRNASAAGGASASASATASGNQASTSIVHNTLTHASTSPNAVPRAATSAVVLTEAQELLRLEILSQRNRIELSLQQDLDHHRRNKQTAPASQGAINASAVLAAALVLVPEAKFAAQVVAEETSAGNGQEDDSLDSLDEKTFYSSQHDTPEFQPASPVVSAPPVSAMSLPVSQQLMSNTVASDAAANKVQDNRRNVTSKRQLRTYDELAEPPAPKPPQNVVPGLNNYINNADDSQSSLPTAKVPDGKAADSLQPSASKAIPTQPSSYIDLHPPSPLLQNKIAAEPRLSSQTKQNQSSQVAHNNGIPGLQQVVYSSAYNNARAPAPVAALRSEPESRTSPETSSQGGQGNKRKNKRKKRKSDRQALEPKQSFDIRTQQIKAEPRSPSPVSGPSYLRPNKRQRQLNDNQVTTNASYDEMIYDPAMPSFPSNPNGGIQQQRTHRPERQSFGYEGSMYPGSGGSMTSNARVSREYVAERVMADDGRRREYTSQPSLTVEYPARGAQLARPQVSQIANHPDTYRDGSVYGNSPQAAAGYSVRPGSDGYHESAQPRPARILVDAYGREYIEPGRQIIRHSVAPSSLPGGPDGLFERAAPQAVSRLQAPGALDERGGYMFAQSASPYNTHRRILTQPEYVLFDAGEGRYREYSSRPMATAGQYVPLYADEGRGAVNRASSMHAMAMEQTRVPSGAVSYGHGPDVRREASGVMYEVEQGAGPTGMKFYGSWPGNHGLVDADGGGGGGVYAGAVPNNGASSGGLVGDGEAIYRHNRRPDGFR